MISASTAVQNTLKQSLAINAVPRVVCEWNQNRYATVSTVENWGSSTEAINGFDLDVFPISSITNPIRPTAGILNGKTAEGVATSTFSDAPGAYRTYTSSPTSKYKYWTSQVPAGATVNGGGGLTIDSTKASPYVLYSSLVYTNKIYLCFETSYSKPVVYNIDTTTDGTTWTTVATNVVPNSDGTVVLYRQANNSWTSTQFWANPTQLKGIRVVVSSVSVANSYLNVIEMGLRLEDDLSPYLISYTIDNEMGDEDFVSPIGTVDSNVATVTLSNVDGRFNRIAPAGDTLPLYRGLTDSNAKITIDLGIDSTTYGGSKYEYVRMATMYTDFWGSDDLVSTLNLKDASKFLQEMNPNRMLMANVTAGWAIWRILDSVGFNSYKYTRSAVENANKINYYWTDSEKTVWEQIQEICAECQVAAYFDANGILQVKTQQAAFDFTSIISPSWTVDYSLNGSKQPDLIDISEGDQFEANKVTIHYKPTALASDRNGRPMQEVVWQPDGDVVLRSSGLKADMDSSQLNFVIDPNDAVYWPYSGMVNIRGELIRYDGKTYRYVDKNNTWQSKNIHSTDEKLHVDNDLSLSTKAYQNYFTGKMIIVERGYDWTTAASHDTTIATWKSAGPAFGGIGGTQTAWTGGLTHLPAQTLMRMTGRSAWDDNLFYEAPHGTVFGVPPTNMGMRFRFPAEPKGNAQHGGIFFMSNVAMNTMYIIDIVSTGFCDTSDLRTSRDEVSIMKRNSGALTSLSGRGQVHTIAEGVWYDVDILFKANTISVFINGHLVVSATDSSLTSTAKLGLYTRGYTVMDFEYFYYAASGGWPDPDTDNSSYLDLIRGGYYSEQHYKDGFYRTREARRRAGKRTTAYKQRYAQRYFDEFGILVHEVRPFTVTFDKGPCTYSDLYWSNVAQAVCLDYVATPFGAEFTLANASRDNAIIQGADDLTFQGNTVNHVLMVTGRTIQQQDEKTKIVTNDNAIRARGEITLDISSDWIQTDDHAQDLANWVTNNWSTPADIQSLTVFGNPLFELTDVIAVNYTPKNFINTTFFVTKISHDFSEGGLATTLELRRARTALY